MTTSNPIATEGLLHHLTRNAWQSLLMSGILSTLLGAIILIWSGPSLVVAGILFGVYLLSSGILQVFAAFGPRISGGWRAMSLLSGILSFVLAFFCLRNIGDSLVLLAFTIGISWTFRGIAAMIAGIDNTPGIQGRGWAILFGILLVLGGIALFVWPINSIATLMLVVGSLLVAVGLVEIVYSFRVRGYAKRIPANR